MNAYLEALDLIKQHHGTSEQAALAKCILSLYNCNHAFSIGEVLGPLDHGYARIVLDMVAEYASNGDTDELRTAGRWVSDNFPKLVELSKAMSDARFNIHDRWDREREEELARLYPDKK